MLNEHYNTRKCNKGSLYYPPVQRPRPYSCVTEVDPYRVPFLKTDKGLVWHGFSDYKNPNYYGTSFTSFEGVHTRFYNPDVVAKVDSYTENLLLSIGRKYCKSCKVVKDLIEINEKGKCHDCA